METALRKLRTCHASENTVVLTKCGSQQRSTVLAHAAAPLTHSQRALLHTAIRRGLSSRRQQEGHDAAQGLSRDQLLSQDELQSTGNGLVEQLVGEGLDTAPYPQQLQHQTLHYADATEQSVQYEIQPMLLAKAQRQLLQRPAWDSSMRMEVQLQQPERRLSRPQQQQQRNNSISSDASVSIQTQQQLLQLRQLLRQQEQRRRQLELQLRTQPAVLTALIKGSKTWQQLQHLFSTYTSFFNPVHVSAALTHLGQILGPLDPEHLPQQSPGLQQLLADLASATAACVPDYGSRQLANTLWALNRLGFGERVPRKVQAAYLTAFAQKMPGAAPQHVSNVALAVAGMGWGTSTQWRQRLLLVAASKQQSFKPQELANLLYALPLLEAKPSQQWLTSFLDICYNHMPNFNSQELSLLGMGLVRLNHKPRREWLDGYSQAVRVQLDATGSTTHYSSSSSGDGSLPASASGQEVTGHIAAAAAAAVNRTAVPQQPDFASEAGAAAAGAQQQLGFQAQGLVNVLRVLCCWGVTPEADWQASCLAAAEQLCPQLSTQGTSTLLWTMARLQLSPSRGLLARLMQQSQQQLRQATPTDFALMAWGLGTLGVTVPHSSCRLDIACRATVPSSSSMGVGSKLMTSWADDFLYYSHRSIGAASAKDVACLLVGMVRMHLKPDLLWLEAAAVEVHHRLDRMTATELTSSLLCLARLKLKPNAAFLASFCSCSSKLLSTTAATIQRKNSVAHRRRSQSGTAAASSAGSTHDTLYCPQTLANTLGALAMLHYQPPQSWCGSFLAASMQLLPEFTPRDFSFTIWGLVQLDIKPHAQWMDVFLVQLRQHVPVMDSAQLSAVIWGLAKLNHRPGVDWMQRFLNRVVALTGTAADQQQQPPQPLLTQEENESCNSSSSWDTVAVTAAGGTGLRSSRHVQFAGAPPAVLQLSADFSSIILHGLTLWAVQRLEYSVPGSSGSSSSREYAVVSSSSRSNMEAVPQAALAGVHQETNIALGAACAVVDSQPAAAPASHCSCSSSSSITYLQSMPVAHVAVNSCEAATKADAGVAETNISSSDANCVPVATTISRDGGIVFHF